MSISFLICNCFLFVIILHLAKTNKRHILFEKKKFLILRKSREKILNPRTNWIKIIIWCIEIWHLTC